MAADLSFFDQDNGAVSRSVTEAPPNHYVFKIQLFSQLAENNVERYVTTDFEAGGYKWKLVLHPSGNKDKGINDHISLYLSIAQVNSLPSGWEIRAVFRLFLLDQNRDNYITLQDAADPKGKRFHQMKQEWGFDKFISHTAFTDSRNGYLVDDSCVFGAEVYISQERHSGKGECLSMIKDPITYKNICKIENFSSSSEECIESKPFMVADRKWILQLYPNRKGSGTGSHISLYLTLAEHGDLPPMSRIYAEFTLRILDQLKGNNYFGKANYWFSATNSTRGWPRFVSHAYFRGSNVGLLVNNICLLEAEITIQGVASAL